VQIETGKYVLSADSRLAPVNPFIEFSRNDIEQSLGDRFEQIVNRDPLRIAVKLEDRAWTYATLNRMANRIARAVCLTGGSTSEPIAVYGGNDVETLAAILGVLKAGKIYVPLDRSFSKPWVQFILKDTQTRTIITTQKDLGVVESCLNPSHVLIDFDTLGRSNEEHFHVRVSPDALSQILYTSGTTGQPKGVMDDHRNMLHNIMRLTNALHISPQDRLTLVRLPSSGGGLCNVLLALLNGSTLYPVDLKQLGLGTIAAWLRQEKITIFYVGAVVFRHFCQQLSDAERFPEVRLIRVGSGQMFDKDVELFKRHFPGSLLLHNLSCTEANTYRVLFLNKDSKVPEGALPVGYALEDMEVLILDNSGRSVAVGEVGEIALCSPYLFRGYWNNSELTNAAFVGVLDADGRKTFRTGDLGRLQPDGCLEYWGRKDFRLKVRGHRIQAEEVELALLRVPGIGQAVVLAQKDDYGDDRLVAYLTPTGPEIPTIGQIRKSLEIWLADYMVPSKFIILDALPQASNGRVKRQELPTPGAERPILANQFNTPTNTLEMLLVRIWRDALRLTNVGVHDNFFDLGGDSIMAMKIIAQIGRIFPWNITLAEFYEACTVALSGKLLIQKSLDSYQVEKIAALYLQIESMSSSEVDTLLANERGDSARQDKDSARTED
jgi:amino acid adenylation domain-containing protein